jgi:hypothetical protein
MGGWIILRWILKRYGGTIWSGFIWLWMRTGGGHFGNEPSVSIERWEVLEWLSDWWLLKKGLAP